MKKSKRLDYNSKISFKFKKNKDKKCVQRDIIYNES